MNSLDYHPFGMEMPNRHPLSHDYAYGYQGSMKDDEILGISGSLYTTEFRELDTRLGRWWGLDPKASAEESPYISMADNPILMNDIFGDVPGQYVDEKGSEIGSDGKDDKNVYLVNREVDKNLIKENEKSGKTTSQSELKGDFFLLPTYEERQKFKEGVYEPAMADDSREYAMFSTETADFTGKIGYVYNEPGPLFTLKNEQVKGSADPNTVAKTEGNYTKAYPRFMAHSHNYSTSKFFGFDKPVLKKPSASDIKSIKAFKGGIIFDTENKLTWVYKSKQRFVGKIDTPAFFKKFSNE